MNERLEQYLTEVDKWLRWLPATRRQEDVAELRAHLENAVAGAWRGQNGDAITQDEQREAATREVLLQFGPARRVALQLGFAHGRGFFHPFRGSFAGAFLAFVAVNKIIMLIFLAIVSVFGSSVVPSGDAGMFLGLLIAVTMSVLATAFAPRRAPEGALAAYLLVAVIPALLSNLHPNVEHLTGGLTRTTVISLVNTLIGAAFYVGAAAATRFLLIGRSRARI